MRTTVAVIQKPEKILQTASLFDPDGRSIKNSGNKVKDEKSPGIAK